MLDIRRIKENPEEVIARLAHKGKDAKEEIEENYEAQTGKIIEEALEGINPIHYCNKKN